MRGYKYCDIQYASYSIYCNQANPKIENNTFSSNSYAIYLYYSSPSIKSNSITNDRIYANNSSPYLDNNYLTNTSDTYPFYLYQSSPELYFNTLKGGYMTVKAYYYSSPEFGCPTDTTSGYNKIDQNNGEFALMAENHAAPFLGSTYVCAYRRGGNNTVSGDDKNLLALVMANNYSNVDAEYTWWGKYPAPTDLFSADGTSSIKYAHALESNPGGGSSLGKVLANSNINTPLASLSDPPCPAVCDSLWTLAENLRKAGMFSDAVNTYKILIDQFSNTPQAHYSLVRIFSLSAADPAGLNNYLVSLENKQTLDIDLKAAAKDVLTNSYNKTGNHQNAVNIAEQILQQFPGTEHEYTGLFNLFNIYQKNLSDESNAKKYLEILKTNYSDYELTLIAQFDMGEPVDWKLAKRFVPQPPASTQTIAVPKDYRLGTNYPNPFNPNTIIPYELPEDTHVKLTIYDMLGREVITLVNASLFAGYKQTIWDGRDRYSNLVANGVYIYNIQANCFSQSRKLLFLK
ncbi:MAG: T9SS type A sorting domain-containing protein [Methanosarcinaceae archaeon]